MAINIGQVEKEALATIDAALTILEKYPELEDASSDINLNLSTSVNPFNFLMEIFKHTSGYDVVVKILSKFIAYMLPSLELSIKAILANKLKEYISCSVNPKLSEEVLKNGVVIGLDELMMTDKLNYSPFDSKVGKYFYFGTENCNVASDLKYSTDFDALLWFLINHGTTRETWRPDQTTETGKPLSGQEQKHTLQQGIITVEYNQNAKDLRDAYNETYRTQVPYNNCLHVFIGDTRCFDNSELTNSKGELKRTEISIDEISKEYQRLENKKIKLLEEQELTTTKYSNGEINEEEYLDKTEKISKKLLKLEAKKQNLDRKNEDNIKNKKNLIGKIVDIVKGNVLVYDNLNTIKNNYFFNKTLIEFNASYISSLKLFDSKVIAARLLDALTGALSIDFQFSYKQQLIHEEIKKMVSMVVESDDIVVSDCFFTFSNKDYDDMYRKTELRRAGLLSIDGHKLGTVKIDAEKILSSLNELNKSADNNVVETVIESALYEVSAELSDVDYDNYYKKVTEKTKLKDVVRMNILDNFLNELSYVLVSTLFSPKVYLLMAINLKIMGEQPKFILEDFIKNYKNLIGDMIRAIRDQLMQYIVSELMKQLGNLAKEIANKIAVEQIRYYMKLLKHCFDCFKSENNTGTIGWEMDKVDYADILPDDNITETKNEC